MPQTRFVLRQALLRGHRAVVVVNKMDRPAARPEFVVNSTFDLFIDLGASDEQAEFAVVFANALNGQAGTTPERLGPDLAPLFDAILELPAPEVRPGDPLQLLVTTLDYDSYVGVLGIGRVTTFVGADQTKSVDENWPKFKKVWEPLVKLAESQGVRIGIENCPMLYTNDEWPGGKNLAYSPAIWRRMFEEIPTESFGLNYDPSHLVWQKIDYITPLFEFAPRILHVHAKDARVDQGRLNDVGILATPLEYHTPKLPGLGDVDWGKFLSVLGDVGYDGAVCIEVEDRVYEGSLESRKAALCQSARFLRQYMA